MSIYLHDIPLDQAQERFQNALQSAGLWGVLGSQEIPLDEHALDRVLSEPVWASISSPHYHASAMDGFAVRSVDTDGAQPSRPVRLNCPSQAEYVDTGDPLPEWADSVIPIEQVEPIGSPEETRPDPRRPDALLIRSAVTPWSHVRPMGEDIVATQLVLPAGHQLRPVDLGALAASGQTRLRVARKPRVAVLPTGTELVPIGSPLKAGNIIEYNSIVLAAQVEAWGGTAERFPITPDDFGSIQSRVKQAVAGFDLVLLNAGSSAGSEDFSARVIAECGQVLVHGVAVRPGHPVILGMCQRKGGQHVPVIGMPGYPVSAALTGEIFVEPLLRRWLGLPPSQPQVVEAVMTRKLTSPAGDDDYLRVAVGRVGANLLAGPLSRGAGVITSLARADGIVVIPRGSQGVEAGARVRVRLYQDPAQLERTIFVIGSHDLTLDLLAQFLASRGRRLVSVNVGSQGGLVAIRRGETHFSGCHLMDPDSGAYNLKAVKDYLPDTAVRLVRWVHRQQGLLIPHGNPKDIQGLESLARSDVRFVNRQRGAGTRVLLDYHLDRSGMPRESVRGYEQEEYTHLAVAAAVSSGRADCGLGIAAAAQALQLDFLPLYEEQYDLVIPRVFLDSGLLDPVFELALDGDFRRSVAALPGYDVSRMGEISADIG